MYEEPKVTHVDKVRTPQAIRTNDSTGPAMYHTGIPLYSRWYTVGVVCFRMSSDEKGMPPEGASLPIKPKEKIETL